MSDISYEGAYSSNQNGTLKGDEVVISGISGVFPASDNVREFMDNLYNKTNMVTKVDDYNHIKHSDMPKYFGKINGTSKFDAQFFRVTHWQASSMDPLTRKMMEHTYSAIFDSGINPLTLNGTKLGVFIGSSYSDIVAYNLYNAMDTNSFLIPGCSKTMISNRISYWINGKGPSYSIDQASGSTYACLEIAYRSIKSGECDAAIVGGGIKITHPILSLNLKKLGLLCMDGKTKCFDKTGDGYVRSEAVSVLFIQRARDAKRIYTEICHVKGKYFTRPDASFLPIREPEDIQNFLNEFYSEVTVSPDEVEYVEASGSGIAEADGKELEAIGQFFASEKAIKVGSLNSNIGNTEPASCACALTKICAAYHTGILPANLHYDNPQDHIIAIRDEKVQILTDNTKFNRGYSALNHFSPTGPNYHILLKGHFKAKKHNHRKTKIPYIVPVSGRQDASVNKILNALNESTIDIGQIALLHNIFQHNIPGHTGRGYIILDTNENKETLNLGQQFEWNSTGGTRDVWFLYTGMGSQWPTMGRDLMRIPIFASAIKRCHRVLEPTGLNLIEIITVPEDNIFDSILHSFVGITAVQIGLTDVLKDLGIVPNYIIGHSHGELGCAYADGCMTGEDTILASYYRGVISKETKVKRGLMAAVGLGYKDVKDLCPPGVEVACHNSSKSSTLSGPFDIMKQFLAELTARGVFVREVHSSNIAYHSKYIAHMGPLLLSNMKSIIKQPKLRSNKWISTSVPKQNWESAKYASAEYFTNNLLNPVYFEEASSLISDNAIVIEIAPHALLQAILKRSHEECTHIPLTRREHSSPVNYLLEAIGRMYLSGLNPKVSVFYPKVEFPVATETSILSDLVEWEHSETWPVKQHNSDIKQTVAAHEFIINIDDDDYRYFKGHVRNGHNVIPESALLVLVWETFAMFHGSDYRQMSIQFENITFYRELIIKDKNSIRLHVTINRGKQIFEVTQAKKLISSGIIQIHEPDTYSREKIDIEDCEQSIDQNYVYMCLESKGLFYRGEFQTVYSTNVNRNKALIKWTGNWVTFLDGIIQLNILANDYENVSMVKFINKLIVDVDKHKISTQNNDDNSVYYDAESNSIFKEIRCGGVLMESVLFKNIKKQHLSHGYTVPDNLKKLVQNLKLVVSKTGCLDSFTWEEVPNCLEEHYSVQVAYAGLSFKDYDNIFNNDFDNSKYFGMDFSGYNNRGEKVMGVIREGALGKTVKADLDLIWPVPEHWSLEEAATVPLPYLQAYYCLVVRGNLLKNQRVFVTGGAGALAQAVISICISMNCVVYTIVNTVDKRKFLLKLFPELDETNIGYSRGPEIQNIVSTTEAKRCDIVINCSSGYIRKAAMKFVGLSGTFLDLSTYDAKKNEDFGMSYLNEGREYKHCNISEIFKEENLKEKKLLQKIITEGIIIGEVRPLSRVSYAPENIQKAFGLLSHSKHRGRVLIQMKDLELSKINIQPRVHFSSSSVYAIICEKTVDGVELINFLITRGARKFIVNIRDNFIAYLQDKLKTWANNYNNIEVIIHTEKSQTIDNYKNLLYKSKAMGPLEGIFIFHDDSNNKKNANEMIVETVDLVSKKKFIELRFFVILDTTAPNFYKGSATFNDKRVCEVQLKSGLNVVVIHNEEYFESNFDKEHIKSTNGIKQMLHNLEMSLRFENIKIKNSLRLESKQENEINFLSKLSAILGLKVISDSQKELTLKELNILDTKYEEVKYLLEEIYLRCVLTEELKQMSLSSIINVGNRNKELHYNMDRSGMGAFYTYVEKNEYIASEPIIAMKTKFNPCDEKEEEIDPNDTHLIMLPGYEGQHRIFKPLSEYLKVRAVTAQFDFETKEDTIQLMAANILKNIKRRIQFESKFYLFGYSFGVNVALELAALLEQEGYTGVVFCFDSSPDALRVQIEAHLGDLNNTELENAILTHIYKIVTSADGIDITNKLSELTNWSEKVNTFISLIKCKVSYSHQYLKNVVEAVYRRLKLAKNYNPNIRLESELILIKRAGQPTTLGLAHDYNLSKYTKQKVKIFDIDSNHTSLPQNCKVASIVNSLLDSKTLKAYETKNRCDFYYY